MSLENLSRARVGYARAIAPTARRSMHPLDDVVPDVERIGIYGHQLYVERIAVPRRIECLIPPSGAVEQCRSNRLGGAAVQVIHDRLHGLAHGRRRILLLEPMAGDEAFGNRLGNRRRVIEIGDAERTGARIECERFETGTGQLDERMMLVKRDRLRARRHVGQPAPGSAAARLRLVSAVAREREQHVQFRIFRKRLRAVHVNGASPRIDAIGRRPQALDYPVNIAQQELRRIDQHAAVRLGSDRETPQHRLGERFLYCAPLVGAVTDSAVRIVRLDHEHFGTDAFERDDMLATQLSTVETYVVRTEPRRQSRDVKDFRVERRNLEPQYPTGNPNKEETSHRASAAPEFLSLSKG